MENKLWITPILYGLIAVVGTLLASSFMLSLLLHFTALSETAIHWFLLPITLITLFAGGFIAGLKSGTKGWYVGGVTGLAFLLLVWLISFLGFDTAFRLQNLLIYSSYLLSSVIGGVIGVNMSPKKF